LLTGLCVRLSQEVTATLNSKISQIGFEEAGANSGRRKGRFYGEIFQDGILEAIIEQGRKNLLLFE
jgi:hypothetical protein